MSSPTIVIVGAGFGGIAAAIELRRHGFQDITILEGAPDLGGTWFYNSYPGAACDVPSHLYSFSYEQRHELVAPVLAPAGDPRLPARGGRRVRHHAADPLLAARRATAPSTPAASRWTVETESGESYDADVLILATGQLNRPVDPGAARPGALRRPQLPLGALGSRLRPARQARRRGRDRRQRRPVRARGGPAGRPPQRVPADGQLVSAAAQPRLPAPGARRDPPRSRAPAPAPQLPLQLLREPHAAPSATRARIGRLAGMRSAAFMRRQLPDPELRAPGLARLHLRLQARPVQLPLPAHARPTQRRARHRTDHRGHRDGTAHRRRARPRGRLHHLGDGLQGHGVRGPDARGRRRRAHARRGVERAAPTPIWG